MSEPVTSITLSPVEPPADEDFSFASFARKNFQSDISVHFSRKEIRNPILKATPPSEKNAVRKVDKIIMRFMGDLPDYRQNMSFSRQPNLGSVMTRMYKELGVGTADYNMTSLKITKLQDDEVSRLKTLPSRPKNGTMRRLTASIAQRLFRGESRSIFDMLPLEESLRDSIDHVHYVAGYGILRPQLRDEIYCMLCKQISSNPIEASVSHGWHLMQLVAGIFTPSDAVLPYIVRYLNDAPQIYAANVKKQIERTSKNGTRCQPPSHVEIEACVKRKPIELSVTLMDSTSHHVQLDSASTSKEVCKQVANAAGLKSTFGFSLFAAMRNKVASLGNGSDHVLDSVSQCEQLQRDDGGREPEAAWRLFFRKEFFVPWEDTVHDPVATNLIYAQITRGVTLGEYSFDTEEDLAMLAAQQYFIESGSELCEESLQAQLLACIPAALRTTDDALTQWRMAVMQLHRRHFSGKGPKPPPTPYRVRLDIVQFAVTRWASQFCRRYSVHKLEGPDWSDESLTLVVSAGGVAIHGHANTPLTAVGFEEITDIFGEHDDHTRSSHVVMLLLINGGALKFESFEADDIRQTLHFIMRGLRQRSTHAIATPSTDGLVSGDIAMAEGDLILLSAPAASGALKHAHCAGTNIRTGEVGQVASNQIYVLATIGKPTAKIMALFQKSHQKIVTNAGSQSSRQASMGSDTSSTSEGAERTDQPGEPAHTADRSDQPGDGDRPRLNGHTPQPNGDGNVTPEDELFSSYL